MIGVRRRGLARLRAVSDAPKITIPPDLQPSDGRFGSGPSKVRTESVTALAAAAPTYLGTSHRREGVHSVVRRIRESIATLLALPDDYEVLLGNGGTTAFWDGATVGLIEHRSQHLSFGEFSSKFAAAVAAAPHLEAPEVIASELGTHPEARTNNEVDVYALTQNETSTGVSMPIERPDRAHGLVVVDATSAAGGLRVDPSEFDVYYFAPQKSFGADGGLWVAACSPAAVGRIEHIGTSDRWQPPSVSLPIALDQSRRDQTYNTPALATLFLLANQIKWMLDHGGLEWSASRCDASAAIVYSWAEAHQHAEPFVSDPGARSHVTATIDFDDVTDAATIAAVLRANGIVDTEPYRKLGRNQLRIALFPTIEPDDVRRLTQAIDFIIDSLATNG